MAPPRVRITCPISTMKSASEAIIALLGHNLGPWELRGTPQCQIYYAKCIRSECNEEIRVFRSEIQWIPLGECREERQNWRMLFGAASPSETRTFFDFGISPSDSEGDYKSRSGCCEMTDLFRRGVLNLDADYFCSRLRPFR